MRKIPLWSLCLLPSCYLGAETLPEQAAPEKILVTATRHPLALNEAGATVIVLDRQKLEEKGAQTVADALQGLPGISLRRTGGLGGNTEIFMRGNKGGHTLIMVDGVEWSDPTAIEKNADIGDLPLQDIERIEIVKGPHSVAYGASGLSGVVHIITRRPQKPFEGSVGLKLGSFDTYGLDARLGGKREAWSYQLAASGLSSGGESAADVAGGDADGYRRKDLSVQLGYQSSPAYLAQLNLRGGWSDAELDGGSDIDDPNSRNKLENLSGQLLQQWNYAEVWETRVTVGLQKNERRYIDDVDSLNPSRNQTWVRSRYQGERRNLELSQTWQLAEQHSLSVAAQWLADLAEIRDESVYQAPAFLSIFPEERLDERSYSFQWQGQWGERLAVQAGTRYLDVGSFTPKAVGQLAGRLNFAETGTVLRLNYGRGYRTPSLYQLKDPTYGEANLQPETVLSTEGAIEQGITPQLVAKLVAFENKADQLIDFNLETYRYYNVNSAWFKGQEYQLEYLLGDAWTAEAQYTKLTTLDRGSNQSLPGRPSDLWAVDLLWKASDLSWRTSVSGQSRSLGQSFLAASKGYRMVDTNLVWKQGQQRYSVRVNNLANTRYQQVAGYKGPGRSVLVGLESQF